MTIQLFPLDCPPLLMERLIARSGEPSGGIVWRHFPDSESHVRITSDVADRDIAIVCTLDCPDKKLIALFLAVATLRELGARQIGLVAPYLPYLRQDIAFADGEAISAKIVSKMIGERFDWLVTLEPHLHRIPSLETLYSIPAVAVSASEPVASWISSHIDNPVLIGPDRESGEWISRIASQLKAPSLVLRKTRKGDRDVDVEFDGASDVIGECTPVIVDDVASTASTLVAAVDRLRSAGAANPACVVVHPIFSGDSYSRLYSRLPAAIVSTNSIAHPTNAIDVSRTLWNGVLTATKSA